MSSKAVALLVIILSTAHTANCQALETDNFLIVADTDLHNVYHVEYTTGDTTQLLQYDDRASPFAVAYDPNTEMVYWSDHSYKTINCYSLLWRNSSTIYTKVPSRIEGLALDSDSQKLYYTDPGNYLIGVMSTDGSDHRVLVKILGSKPRAIVVDSVNGMLYWTDWSTNHPGIYRAPLSNVSSSTREPVITTDITWPNALAIDFSAGVMYFGDGFLDTIEMANVDGSGRVLILNESWTDSHFFALALDTDFIYFTDWSGNIESKYIRRMHRTSLETSTVMSSVSFLAVNGLARFVSPPTTTTEAQTTPAGAMAQTSIAGLAGADDSSFPLTIVIAVVAVVAVIIIVLVIICIIAACKWRRGLIEKVAAEEQRREEAEDEAQYQIHQRRELQKQCSTPATSAGIYEDINMEESGYSIPDFLMTERSSRDGYEQLPKPNTAPTLPEPRPTAAMTRRGNSYAEEPESHYSKSLPPI